MYGKCANTQHIGEIKCAKGKLTLISQELCTLQYWPWYAMPIPNTVYTSDDSLPVSFLLSGLT